MAVESGAFHDPHTKLAGTNVRVDLSQMYEPPRDRQDAETLRQYMSQVRQELAVRLLARVFPEGGDGKPSKWWLSFTKRKFMGKGL